MRETWELPGLPARQRLIRGAIIVALVWALVAVPLTLWLALRDPQLPPEPPTRELSVMEGAAANLAVDALSTGYVQVVHQVSTPATRFDVTETVQAATGDAVGTVASGSQTADLLVAGGTTYLRAGSAFWSTFGVPTTFPGWVVVDGMLGELAFPLKEAAAGLKPGGTALIETPQPGADTLVYRTDKAAATFISAGIAEIWLGDRSAQVKVGVADASPALNAARADSTVAGKLVGSSGAMTVTEPAQSTPEPTATG